MPLKVRPRKGTANLYLRGTVRGIPVDESTGTDDPEIAQAIRIKRESELLHRSVFGEQATVSFLAAAVEYLETPRSRNQQRYVKRLYQHFGTKPLHAITQEAVDEAARKLYPGASAETVNRQVYTPVVAILHARGEHRRFRRPRQKKPRNRFLAMPLAETLVDACGPKGTPLRALLVLLFTTGCRISEALRIEWQEHVDLSKRSILLDLSKTGEDGWAPMHEWLFEELASMPGRVGFVFPWRTRGGADKHRREAIKRLGISFTFHMARHSFATWLRQEGKDLRLVQEAGRWSDIKSVARYSHVEKREVREAVTALPFRQNPGSQKRKRRKSNA